MISDEQLDEWERECDIQSDSDDVIQLKGIACISKVLALIAEVRRLRGKAEILFPTGRRVMTPLEAEDE